jgi:hypothetical protein
LKFKRIISVLLCVAILMSSVFCINIVSFAQTNPTVYSDINASQFNAGDTIQIPISIKNNTGIMGWMLTFSYDADVFEPISVEYGEVISGGIQDNIEGDAQPGSFNVYWAGSENETYNGIMFYVNFAVDKSSVGSTEINVSFSQEDTFDEDFNDVYLNCNSINLNITNNDYSQYAKINAVADDVIAGEELQLKLNFSEINNVSNTNLTIDYDENNFEIKSVNSLDGVKVDSIDDNGKLVLNVSNITDSLSGSDLVTIIFKSNDNAFSGNHDFNVSSTDEGIICKGCTVNISASSTSEIAKIYADDVTANYDDTITVPVKIENNHGIMGYRLRFEYDPTQLEIISAENGENFTGNFNDSIGNKSGEFDVLWNTTENNSTDGTLLKLNFKVITEDKLTSAIKVSYLQEDTFNESYNDVVFDCKDIQLNLNQIDEPDLTDFVIKTVSLSLESSITMNFKVLKSALSDYENPYLKFTCEDDELIVTDYTEQGNYYVFSYPGISPQLMNDNVNAVLCAIYKENQKEYSSVVKSMSVKEYAYTMLSRYNTSSYSKLRTLLVDLLNYGAAAQVYVNYQTDNLVNSELTDTQKSWGTSTEPSFEYIRDYNYKTISNPTSSWVSSGLVLNNSVMIRAKFTSDDIENKTVKIVCGKGEFTYSSEDFVKDSDGNYYVYCNEIFANEMSKEILLTVYDNGVQCSNTMRFSIESYAKLVHDSYSGTALDNLTIAMMRYGKSAEAYGA